MENFRRAWKGKPVALLLFIACFFLLNWPLLSIPAESGGILTGTYLLLLWLCIILGLWVYSRSEAEEPPEKKGEEKHT
jgi:hypothetical protein